MATSIHCPMLPLFSRNIPIRLNIAKIGELSLNYLAWPFFF